MLALFMQKFLENCSVPPGEKPLQKSDVTVTPGFRGIMKKTGCCCKLPLRPCFSPLIEIPFFFQFRTGSGCQKQMTGGERKGDGGSGSGEEGWGGGGGGGGGGGALFNRDFLVVCFLS